MGSELWDPPICWLTATALRCNGVTDIANVEHTTCCNWVVGQRIVPHCRHSGEVSHVCKLCILKSNWNNCIPLHKVHLKSEAWLTGSITCWAIRLTDKAFQFPLDFHWSLHEVQTMRGVQGESMLSLIPNSIWNAIALSHILLPICHTRPPYSSNLIPEQRAPLIWREREWRKEWGERM